MEQLVATVAVSRLAILKRNVHQQATSSLSEVETDSQSDIVDRVQA